MILTLCQKKEHLKMKAVVFIFPLASFKKSKIILLFLYVTASHAYRALGGQSVLFPWDWSYRLCRSPYGCWEWSLGLPREHSVLSALTCPPSSSSPRQLLSCKHIGLRTTCFHLHGTTGALSCAFALQLGLNEGQRTSWVPCDSLCMSSRSWY